LWCTVCCEDPTGGGINPLGGLGVAGHGIHWAVLVFFLGVHCLVFLWLGWVGGAGCGSGGGFCSPLTSVVAGVRVVVWGSGLWCVLVTGPLGCLAGGAGVFLVVLRKSTLWFLLGACVVFWRLGPGWGSSGGGGFPLSLCWGGVG